MIGYINLAHEKKSDIYHVHATGSYGFRWMPKRLEDLNIIADGSENLNVCEYIYNMPQMMAAADLVICRAGSTTIFELAAMGKPAILIPSPNVAENHQYFNAMALQEKGAAVVIEEKDLTPKRLQYEVEALIYDKEKLKKMAENMNLCAIYDANEKIYAEILSLLKAHQ